jgi:asparagine synthase (glutamine-hydrolysing)
MHSPCGRYHLVFNGEIYNYQELITAHLSEVELRTTSDTEVLLHLWSKMGVDCLHHLRGMFALALYDNTERSLHLARDRFGKKPLFYTQTRQCLSFASELPALKEILPSSPSICPTAIDLYLGFQAIPAPHTIYKNIFKLPPAHYAVWQDGELRMERYWSLDYTPRGTPPTEEEAMEQLDHHLREAVRLRMHADVPVGVLLSGGVDSGLVTALAAETSSAPIRTFTIASGERRFNEAPIAREVADRYGTRHEEFVLEADQEDLLETVVSAYGEPFGDCSALPSLLVCREARKHVTVVLNGDGGDELNAGYAKYQVSPLKQALALAPEWTFHAGNRLDRMAMERGGLRGLHSAARFLRRFSPLNQVLSVGTFVRPEMTGELYQPAFLREAASARMEYTRELLEDLPLPGDPLSRLQHLDIRFYLASDLLVKMDIASMSASLEARSPLLDHVLAEFAAPLPADFKVRNGRGKVLLRTLAERYLPQSVLTRQKTGFGVPVGEWFKTPFADHLLGLLHADEQPLWQYLRPGTVRTMLAQHRAGTIDHTSRLWGILILGLWLEREGRA